MGSLVMSSLGKDLESASQSSAQLLLELENRLSLVAGQREELFNLSCTHIKFTNDEGTVRLNIGGKKIEMRRSLLLRFPFENLLFQLRFLF